MQDVPLDIEFEDIEQIDQPNQLNDETISQDLINELKMLGQPKPEFVSWHRWQSIQSERPEHSHMINLAAMGVSQANIAKELGYTDQQVSKVLNVPWVKEKIQEKITEVYGQNVKQALKDRALKAVQTLDDLIADPATKDNVKAGLVTYILDHAIGKAQQTVNHTGSILSDVMIKVEQMQTSQLRDAGGNNPLLTQQDSKFDTILNAIIPEDSTVGKRSKLEEQTE